MGLILDSSLVIAGERRNQTVREILEQLKAAHGNIEMGLSAVTIVELVHGVERAKDEQRRCGAWRSLMNLSWTFRFIP